MPPEAATIETQVQPDAVVETPVVETPAVAPAQESTPEDKTRGILTARIDQLTRDKYELKAQLDAATKATLTQQQAPEQSEIPTGKMLVSEAEINSLALARAQEMAFNRASNEIWDMGVKEFGNEFKAARDNFNTLGGLQVHTVQAVMELDNPHKVLHALGSDIGTAAEILALPPARQAVALAKFAAKLEAKPAVSKAPDPIKPKVSGSGNGDSNLDDDTISMQDWIAKREKELSEKKKRR